MTDKNSAAVPHPDYDSYVVRIYRRDRTNPVRLSGVVEVVATGATHRFDNAEALIRVMNAYPARSSGSPEFRHRVRPVAVKRPKRRA